jgi:hypothetical protein
MNSITRFGALIVVGLCLGGCGRSESFRYKLIMTVNTPDGVKRGSTVTEWAFSEVAIPARGTPHKLDGQALYLDLGPGVRPLVALMTSHLHPKRGGTVWDWPGDYVLDRLYHPNWRDDDFMKIISRLAKIREPRRITLEELPDLVTFADINDPKSVIEVDPNNLQGGLGRDITWNEITLEMTDQPITTGIEEKLPWLPAYFQNNWNLDGTKYHSTRELANSLQWSDFDQSSNLKRSH